MTKYKDFVKSTDYGTGGGLCGWTTGTFSFLLTLKLWKIISKNMASKRIKRCMKIIKSSDFLREMSENIKNFLNLPKLLCKKLEPTKNLVLIGNIFITSS